MPPTDFTDRSPTSLATAVWLRRHLSLLLALCVGATLYFCNPRPNYFYDYTWRIAGALWHGQLGLTELPPPHLNEFVPLGGHYYSVFPLGSVLTLMPLALFQRLLFGAFPASMLAALIGGATTWFAFQLAGLFDKSVSRRVCLALLPVLGSWMWCNLGYEGAWQIALGFAVVGQFGALYFTLVEPRALWAGAFFALAFGNRTEAILAAPIFLFLLWRTHNAHQIDAHRTKEHRVLDLKENVLRSANKTRCALEFCAVPFVLGVLTMCYNHVRFGSVFDFGYARIPGILLEWNYRYGIFSRHAISNNVQKMLFDGWLHIDTFPYWVPSGWGGSIFLSCPFLLLLFWPFTHDRVLVALSWFAVMLMTFVLWIHGDPGGWQYSYRYAMVLLPWFFLILTAQKTRPLQIRLEWTLLALALTINAWATYLFYWTPFVKPR